MANETYRKVSGYLCKETSFKLVLIQKYPQKMILKVSWIDRNCFCEKRLFQMCLNQSKSTPFKTVYE